MDRGDLVLRLLLDYEAAQRGSTSQMLSMGDQRDRTIEKIVEVDIRKDEAVRELRQLTGYSEQ